MAPSAQPLTNPTIVDVAKEKDKSGKLLPHIYALSQANALVNWVPFIECNQARSHMASVETYAPLPSTRILNRGVQSSYGEFTEIEEKVSQLKDWLRIDEDVANYGGDPDSYRVRQSWGRLRAMGRKFSYLWMYGNRGAVPSDFNGLSMRYGAISGAVNAQNVLDAGGRNNTNTSMWLMGFGPEALTGIYPKGSVAGFHHRDWGLRPITNAIDAAGNGNANQAVYLDEFTWDGGLFLADWRHVVATRNIDVPSLNTLTNDADLAYFLDEMFMRLPEETNLPPEPGVEMTKPVYKLFMNRTCRRALAHQIKQVVIQGSGLAKDGYERAYNPQFMYHYNETPIGIVDQIITTEGNIS